MNKIRSLIEKYIEDDWKQKMSQSKKIFIVGNGFDLAHKLPTSYENFRFFLKNSYPKSSNIEPSFNIEGTTYPDGSERYDDNEVVSFLLSLISEAEKDGDNWSDVENSLGHLDFSMFLEDITFIHDNEDNPWKLAYMFEDVTSNFYIPTVRIKELFADWVKSIDIPYNISKKNLNKFVDLEKDLFLSFNYTSTLEDIYNAKNVLYIHGQGSSETEKIEFGHGVKKEDFENNYTGSQDGLMKIHYALMKDTDNILQRNKFFFENLANANSIKNIYSFGFSFSKVDIPYIKKICENMKTKNLVWHLSDFENEETKEEFKKSIKVAGFKGKFSEFHLE